MMFLADLPIHVYLHADSVDAASSSQSLAPEASDSKVECLEATGERMKRFRAIAKGDKSPVLHKMSNLGEKHVDFVANRVLWK